ncbi:hypothetical protein J4462_02545 [Candidatus Pacearchaeota archaeon]|nr:hypothetical protein [Candidatus Pacearchaeota archaeon]
MHEEKEETKPKLRSSVNFYLYYWTILAFFILVFINNYAETYDIKTVDLNLMISIVTFLFGFFVTVTFSMLLTKISSLKEAIAVETGRLVSILQLSKNLGAKFYESIRSHIDDYTIKTLKDYKSYQVGRNVLYAIYDDIPLMEMKTENQKASANSLLYILGEWEPTREKLEYLTSRHVEFPLKLANYLLGTILIILLFLNRGDTFTNALFIVLAATVIFIFLILEDFDALRIGDYTYNISNSEQLFDLIGTERYYPEDLVNRVKLIEGRTYRIGVVNRKTNEERIYSIKYTPASFGTRLANITRALGKK